MFLSACDNPAASEAGPGCNIMFHSGWKVRWRRVSSVKVRTWPINFGMPKAGVEKQELGWCKWIREKEAGQREMPSELRVKGARGMCAEKMFDLWEKEGEAKKVRR